MPIAKYDNPICPECNLRKCYRSGWKKDGSPIFRRKCDICRGKPLRRVSSKKRPYYRIAYAIKQASMMCGVDGCGFKAIHISQLDIDHIDGDKHNNNLENLLVMCANCHRLKTALNEEYKHIDFR
jgi:hypothetical protein